MRILVACEFSGRVRDAFRDRGHDAWSCDLLPSETSNDHHLRCDVLPVAQDGRWDLMIAFPPCNHLSTIGARHWPAKQADGRQAAAAQFVLDLWDCPIDRVAIENPVGWLNTNWMKPTQIVQPFHFGDPWRKRTCLWIRGLPPLVPTRAVAPIGPYVDGGKKSNRAGLYGAERIRELRDAGGLKKSPRDRSLTFPGIAQAMALQWGGAAT